MQRIGFTKKQYRLSISYNTLKQLVWPANDITPIIMIVLRIIQNGLDQDRFILQSVI